MSPKNYNRKLISLAVASACAGFVQPVLAQDTSTTMTTVEPTAPGDVQQVVVTGFRSSLERAINLKRAAIGTRDSIVAEDIGKFPEQNIADALIRLPGVEVVKDPGTNEGQRIQMRGLGAEYTVTTFNGAPVRATSGGSIGFSTRDFNYDIFASELFGRTDVYKTPLAELEEGGVAGVVDMQTPRPFDNKKRVIRYAAATAYNDRSGLFSPRVFGLFSNTWGNWGLLVGVTKSGSKNANAGFSSTGTYASTNQRLDPGSFNYAYNLTDPSADYSGISLAELRNALLPRFFRVTANEFRRERVGFNTSVQWKSGGWDVSLDTLGSKLEDISKTNGLNFPIRDSAIQGANNNMLIPRGVTVDQNNNLQGTLANVQNGVTSSVSRAETEFKYVTLNAKWRATDRLRFTGQIGGNQSDAWNSGSSLNADGGNNQFDNRHAITFNTTDDPLFPHLKTDRDLLDPTLYRSFSYGGSYRTETDKQKIAKLTGEFDYGFWDVEAKVKAGVSRVISDKDSRQFSGVNINALNTLQLPGGKTFGALTPTERTAFLQKGMVSNDLNNVEVKNVPKDFLTFNRDFIYGTLNSFANATGAPANFGGTFKTRETIDAVFLQSDFETKVFERDLRANVGVRYVKTATDIDNYTNISGVQTPTHLEGEYTNTLPSASVSYDLKDDLVWRASWGKTLTRSGLDRIARSISVNSGGGDLIVNTGNPNLKPQLSTSIDTGLEWYFDKGGILAMSLFQKDIKDRPVSGSEFAPFNTLGIPKELFTANLQAILAAEPTTPVEVRRWRNADQFKVKGLELAYQQSFRKLPAPFNNMGAIASYTRVDTAGFKVTYNGASYELPIIPKETYAVTLYYEDGPLAVRSSYNHKSEFANQGAPALNPLGYNRWFNERGYLDASVSYKFSPMLEVRLDGANLTGQRTYDFLRHFEGRYGDEHSRIEQASIAGRTFTLTLRGSF